jgi:hypothetical protein
VNCQRVGELQIENLEIGDLKLEIGNWKLEIGNLKFGNLKN